MKKLIVLSGAGISAESGLKTFRDAGGLWEGYNVYDVATPEAWLRNPELVQEFYNLRRKSVLKAKPNAAHFALVKLEKEYDVTVITQNVDDLHERAGSTNVLHLHGVITKSQSSKDPGLVYYINGWQLKMGDKCELGSQLRPHVVWFGEAVSLCYNADVFIVIGTSLQVYPAAGLLDIIPDKAIKYIIGPEAQSNYKEFITIREKASIGVPSLVEKLTTTKE